MLKSSNKRSRMPQEAPGRACPRSSSVTACFEASCRNCRHFTKNGHDRLFTYAQGVGSGASIKADWVLEG